MSIQVIDDMLNDLTEEAKERLIEREGVIFRDGQIIGFHIEEDETWRLVPEFARDRDFPFFRSAVTFAVECVMEYAKIKKDLEPAQEKKNVWDKIAFDLDKSELLLRLLEGKPAFALPPPKSFKTNWYDLVEDGEGIPETVTFSKWPTGLGYATPAMDDRYVVIDEHGWEIIERRGDDEYVISYDTKAPNYLLRKATQEEQDRLLHPRMIRTSKNYSWYLVEMEEE